MEVEARLPEMFLRSSLVQSCNHDGLGVKSYQTDTFLASMACLSSHEHAPTCPRFLTRQCWLSTVGEIWFLRQLRFKFWEPAPLAPLKKQAFVVSQHHLRETSPLLPTTRPQVPYMNVNLQIPAFPRAANETHFPVTSNSVRVGKKKKKPLHPSAWFSHQWLGERTKLGLQRQMVMHAAAVGSHPQTSTTYNAIG